MAEPPHAVVTGGAGFLGSHLVDDLLADGYRVTSLDNFGSGRLKNLEGAPCDRFDNLDHDVRSPFPEFEEIEVIFHLASRSSPVDFGSYPVEIALTNAKGTHHTLECAREYDAKVLLASTSEVYGDPEVHPQTETYNGNVNCRGPRAPYDEGKRFAEALSLAYERQYGLDVRLIRIFNTYGPRMRPDDGRVIPNFLSQALRGDPLTVYGDGSQTRSFCYVDDLIDGIRTCAGAPADTAAGEVFNLGSTDEVAIADLAVLILNLIDGSSEMTYEPLPEDDPEVRCPDITKARKRLGWEPEVELADGLKRTIEYFRDAEL